MKFYVLSVMSCTESQPFAAKATETPAAIRRLMHFFIFHSMGVCMTRLPLHCPAVHRQSVLSEAGLFWQEVCYSQMVVETNKLL